MIEVLLVVIVLLLLILPGLFVAGLRRHVVPDLSLPLPSFAAPENTAGRTERSRRDDIARHREETTAIERRSSEVAKLLSAAKTAFGKFSSTLDGVKKRLEQASKTMDDMAKRSRVIERQLRHVQELPVPEAQMLFAGDHNEPVREEA